MVVSDLAVGTPVGNRARTAVLHVALTSSFDKVPSLTTALTALLSLTFSLSCTFWHAVRARSALSSCFFFESGHQAVPQPTSLRIIFIRTHLHTLFTAQHVHILFMLRAPAWKFTTHVRHHHWLLKCGFTTMLGTLPHIRMLFIVTYNIWPRT